MRGHSSNFCGALLWHPCMLFSSDRIQRTFWRFMWGPRVLYWRATAINYCGWLLTPEPYCWPWGNPQPTVGAEEISPLRRLLRPPFLFLLSPLFLRLIPPRPLPRLRRRGKRETLALVGGALANPFHRSPILFPWFLLRSLFPLCDPFLVGSGSPRSSTPEVRFVTSCFPFSFLFIFRFGYRFPHRCVSGLGFEYWIWP